MVPTISRTRPTRAPRAHPHPRQAADTSNRSNRQLHITTNLAFSEEPLPDPGSPAKGGDLSARGGKQMSRIAAQLASKSVGIAPGREGGVGTCEHVPVLEALLSTDDGEQPKRRRPLA